MSVDITLDGGGRRGGVLIDLTCPSGTPSSLLGARRDTSKGKLVWTMSTVRCWGEGAAGAYTLRVSYSTWGGGASTLVKWRLVVYGTSSGNGGGSSGASTAPYAHYHVNDADAGQGAGQGSRAAPTSDSNSATGAGGAGGSRGADKGGGSDNGGSDSSRMEPATVALLVGGVVLLIVLVLLATTFTGGRCGKNSRPGRVVAPSDARPLTVDPQEHQRHPHHRQQSRLEGREEDPDDRPLLRESSLVTPVTCAELAKPGQQGRRWTAADRVALPGAVVQVQPLGGTDHG